MVKHIQVTFSMTVKNRKYLMTDKIDWLKILINYFIIQFGIYIEP